MAGQSYPEGAVATNPATGETLVRRGGVWVPQAGPSRAPQPIIPLQATPQTPAQEAAARAAAAAAAANAGRTTAITPADVQGQNLTNQNLQRNLQLPPGVSDAAAQNARARVIAARELLARLDTVEENFRPYEGRTTAGELTPFYHTEGLDRLRSASESLMPLVRTLFRTPDASTTEQENRYYESLIPSTSERDTVNRQRIDELRRTLGGMIGEYENQLPASERRGVPASRLEGGPQAVGRQIASDAARIAANTDQRSTAVNVDPGFNPDAQLTDSPGQRELSTSEQAVPNQQRYEALVRLRAMTLAGAPDDQIIAEAERSLGRGAGELYRNSPMLEYRRTHGVAALRRAGVRIDPESYMENRPLTQEEQRGAQSSQSAFGSFIGHLSNAATGNLVPLAMGGDAQSRLEMSREQHPVASFLGDAAGSALPSTALEAGIGRGLTRLGVDLGEQSMLRYLPRVGANTAYGATYGAASNPDDPLTGAAVGGMTSAVGGEVGAAGPRAVGTVVGGVRAPNARLLSDRGVQMTPGQILRDTQGPVGSQMGRAVSGLEQASTSLPIAGDAITDRYVDSYRTAMNAAHDEALAPIGQVANRAATTGEELMQSTDRAVSEAYDNALRGVTLTPDTGFNRLLTRAEAIGNRPVVTIEQQALLRPAFQQVRDILQNGTVDGPRYQAAMQILRETRAALRDTHLSGPAMSSLDRAEAAFRGMARRQQPGVLPALRSADNAYRHASILRDAQMRAVNAEEGTVSPGQFGLAIRSQTRRYGGNAQASSTNRPFYELQNAMRNTLPDRLPNSGTASRLAVGGLAAGAGGALDAYGGSLSVLPKIAAGLGGLRLAYSGAGRDLMQGALLSRPAFMRRAGDALGSGISQGLGAALGRAYSLPIIEDTLEDDPANPNWRPRL